MFEFVDRHKKIKIGSKIRIMATYVLKHPRQVPHTFVEWIKRYRNIFVIKTIQEVDESAMVTVEEVQGYLEYDQIIPLKENKRVLNWHREKSY